MCIDASQLKSYKTGIVKECNVSINHCVLLTSIYYLQEYWKAKNSWGVRWGEMGYVRLKYGNTCGICAMGA